MMDPQLQPRVDPIRVLLALVLLAVAALVAWTGVMAVWHFPQPVYRLTPTLLVVTLGACSVILLALAALWKRPHPGLSAGVLLVSCLWVLSFISFIGVFTLPISVVLTVVLIVASRRAGGGAGRAVLPAVAVAVSLVVLLFAQPWTAAVRCGESMVRISGRPFDSNSGGSSGSGTGTAMRGESPGSRSMESSGNLSFGEESYVYRCSDGALVEFRRVG